MTSRAPVGNLAIANIELCTNQGFKSFVPKVNIYSEYLYYYLKFIVPQIQKDSHGNTFTEITKSQVEKIKILLPPNLDDQIAIADGLREKLDRVKSDASNSYQTSTNNRCASNCDFERSLHSKRREIKCRTGEKL